MLVASRGTPCREEEAEEKARGKVRRSIVLQILVVVEEVLHTIFWVKTPLFMVCVKKLKEVGVDKAGTVCAWRMESSRKFFRVKLCRVSEI